MEGRVYNLSNDGFGVHVAGCKRRQFDVTGAGVELDRSFVGSKLVEGQSH